MNALDTFVDGRGTRRRIQALVAHGWSQRSLADRIGCSERTVRRMLQGDRVRVWYRDAVEDLFERLWCQEPPRDSLTERAAYTLARRTAAAHGWVPALAWDDIDTDDAPPVVDRDPEYVDVIAVHLVTEGQLSHAGLTSREREEVVRILHEKKYSDKLIAATIGCLPKTVERVRGRLGLSSLPNHMLVTQERGAA